jgi:hypothetical protein
MSGASGSASDEGVVSRAPDASGPAGEDVVAGGTHLTPAERSRMLRRHTANPDDPPVPPRREGPQGVVLGPEYSMAPGRMAIVQGQVYLVGVILVAQLWLITTALWELLSGRPQTIWGLTVASGIGFLIALVVALWPRRRTKGI